MNGAAAEPKLYAGPYAGGFRDAGEADDSTWNLARPSSWTDYQELLESGAYLDQALGEELAGRPSNGLFLLRLLPPAGRRPGRRHPSRDLHPGPGADHRAVPMASTA